MEFIEIVLLTTVGIFAAMCYVLGYTNGKAKMVEEFRENVEKL